MTVRIRPYMRRGKVEPEAFQVDIAVKLFAGGEYREQRVYRFDLSKAKSPGARDTATARAEKAAREWGDQIDLQIKNLNLQHLDAKAIKAKLRGKQEPVAQPEAVQPKVPTLAEFKDRFVRDHLVAERRKPSSVEAVESIYREHLAPALGSKRLDQITSADVQALKAKSKEQGHAPKTTNNIVATLGSMLRRAMDWDVIESMPKCKLLKVAPPAFSFFDFAEYKRLVEAARALDHRIEVTVLLGGDAGLRRGEILGLEWTDLDFQRRVIHVQRSQWKGQVTAPKGGRSRRVPMTADLAAALKAHKHLRGPRVLYTDDGSSPTNKIVRRWMEAVQRKANMPANGRIHVLRHTFCSHLAMQGATATAIQELAGHTTLTMTQRYMHLSPAHKDAAIRLLDRRPSDEKEQPAHGTSVGGP